MKLYEITIRPVSGFGTPLKGDTLFGHFCWQIAYNPNLVEGGLERALAVYEQRPFAVFSSAFFKLEKKEVAYVFPRPELPASWFFSGTKMHRKERYRKAKDLKSRKWMLLTEPLELDLSKAQFVADEQNARHELFDGSSWEMRFGPNASPGFFVETFPHAHNTINRLTQTTGGAEFAPYITKTLYYHPGVELAIFVLVDEEMTDVGSVKTGLESIGRFGYGRDSSAGLGRFDVCEANEMSLAQPSDANACYTMAPCVPEKGWYQRAYFSPFVRFGKHGDRLATAANPFKNPVVMADEGAVFVPRNSDVLERPYVGTAVSGVSKTEHGSVVQGYAPYLPFTMEN